jgi:hypothetical protein
MVAMCAVCKQRGGAEGRDGGGYRSATDGPNVVWSTANQSTSVMSNSWHALLSRTLTVTPLGV